VQYLRTKRDRTGHLIATDDELEAAGSRSENARLPKAV
jgi:hypothetical protein